MNKIKIPKSFQLFGETITVEHRADYGQEKGGIGTAQYKQNKILLQKSTEGDYVEETLMENTFFHELLHFCLENMGRITLNDDEAFITVLSGLLHQAFKTAEYEDDKPLCETDHLAIQRCKDDVKGFNQGNMDKAIKEAGLDV